MDSGYTIDTIQKHLYDFEKQHGHPSVIGKELYYRFQELVQEVNTNFTKFIDNRGVTTFIVGDRSYIKGPVVELEYEYSNVLSIYRTFEAEEYSIQKIKTILPLNINKYFVARPYSWKCELLYYSDEKQAFLTPILDFSNEYYIDDITLKLDRENQTVDMGISYQIKRGPDNYTCEYKTHHINLLTFDVVKTTVA